MLPSLRNWLESLIRAPRRNGPRPEKPPGCVVLIRTDMFGDQVIFGGFIARMRQAWPNTRLVLVTPSIRQHLYEACPDLDESLYFDWKAVSASSAERARLFRRVRALRPDYIINGQFTRSHVGDRIVRYCHARVRLGISGPSPQVKEKQRRKFDRYYTHLLHLDRFEPTRTETSLCQQLLGMLGIPADDYGPRIWTTEADIAFAEKTFRESGFRPEETLVFFSGSSSKLRAYPQLNRLVADMVRDGPWNIIAVGGPSEQPGGEPPDEALRGRWLNLCGRCTIRESAELMRRCRLVLGVETGLAQVALAVGTPQVILQSGAFFGRFLSSSPLTSLAIQPLDCYFCCADCRYEEAYCLTRIPAHVFARALEDALATRSTKVRIYRPAEPPALGGDGTGPRPHPHWDESWINPQQCEAILVESPPQLP